MERRKKPATKGDRYHTKKFGQGLRYGLYAVVAVCVNRGLVKNKTEEDVLEQILSQWKKFEDWAQKQPRNSAYIDDDQSFKFVNYYKGATINADLQKFTFSLK